MVYECSLKANEKIAALIQEKISSKGDCDKEGFESSTEYFRKKKKDNDDDTYFPPEEFELTNY